MKHLPDNEEGNHTEDDRMIKKGDAVTASFIAECIKPVTYFNEHMLTSYLLPMFPWGNYLYTHEIHSLLYVKKKCATFVKHLINDMHYIDHCIEICSTITHEGK